MVFICEYASSISTALRYLKHFTPDFGPVYFQAVKDASPIKSGTDIFGAIFTIAPFAIVNGVSVLLLNRYRPQNYIAWILSIIGMGLLSTLKVDSSKGLTVGYQIVLGAGLGILFTSTSFPVLASVKVTEAAPALAFFTFVRSFAQVSAHVPRLFSGFIH
jgi:hypothetical protein